MLRQLRYRYELEVSAERPHVLLTHQWFGVGCVTRKSRQLAPTPLHDSTERRGHRGSAQVNQAKRSIVRRILESDSSAATHMVLCVSSVITAANTAAGSGGGGGGSGGSGGGGSSSVASGGSSVDAWLELTDGWYAVRAEIDVGLADLVARGKIFVGQLLRVQGVQLMGAGEGCSPVRA